jgi:hypothetical protein
MLQFTVDARDGVQSSNGCATCCCEPAVARPGETNLWQINYAPWAIPIGGRGLSVNTIFDIEKKTGATSPAGNQSPAVAFKASAVTFNTPLTDTVATSVVDPEADDLTFSLLPLYGPSNGEITFDAAGAFTYTPHAGFSGYETFFYQVSDGQSAPRIGEVSLAVSLASPATPLPLKTKGTPAVRVRREGLVILQSWAAIQFPVEISPAALPGDIYRLTIRQEALDCDCNPFYHVSCYDISIGRCA